MRFIMFMIPGIYQPENAKTLPPDFAPTADQVAPMMKYNEELAKAGAIIALDGLHPLSHGARVEFSSGKPKVTDGPFVEAKEVVGGYWIINVKSKEEAVEWARRIPAGKDDVIEVRQIFEISDFPEDVQKAADSPTVRAAAEKHSR